MTLEEYTNSPLEATPRTVHHVESTLDSGSRIPRVLDREMARS